MSSQTLPAKEQGVFKTVVRLYEAKSFKKAIKAADQILKKFPEHGETLAMKGLIVNQLDRKEEAHDLVRLGLRKNMRSHICWHVYGLLYRSDHNYFQAARSYVNALRLDPENQQILRDLALLQVQIRDYEGFEESRRKLLSVRPSVKSNWIGVAISFHLQKNYDKTLEVVKTYLNTLSAEALSSQDPFEHSELLLYRVMVMEEAGQFEMALKSLGQDESVMLDWLAVREMRVRLLTRLGRHEEAAKVLRALIAVNPDNHAYHRHLHAATTTGMLEVDQGAIVDACLAVCDENIAKYSHSRAGQRIALDIIPNGTHPQFLPRADRYIRPFLRRGAPSLFADLKALYVDTSKVDALFTLLESYTKRALVSPPTLPPLLPMPGTSSNGSPPAKKSEETVDASVQVWIHLYLAQHYDRIGQLELALAEVEKAIAHPDTAIECLLVKARILKHCGATKEALAIADQARQQDLSDRFVNTKSTKYSLRADDVPQAEAWISLFTRDGDSGGVQALYDMQCIWYELEAGESHLRCNDIGPALKKFIAVERHFTDMIEDQFDFHFYCLRKVTLRSYIHMLRMEDSLRSHPYFQRAATGVVRCLLRLHDMPMDERLAATSAEGVGISGFADMSEAERKKALSKKKKRDAKKRVQEIEAAALANGTAAGADTAKGSAKTTSNKPCAGKGRAAATANGTGDAKITKKYDASANNAKKSNAAEKAKNPGWMETDVDGLEHVQLLLEGSKPDVTPIGEATQRIRLLEQFESKHLETHVLAFEVGIRKKRYLQALRAVRRAQQIDAESPQTLSLAVRLVHEIHGKGAGKEFPSDVAAVFEKLGDILSGKGAVEAVDEYVSRQQGNVPRLLGAGEVLLWLAQADAPGARGIDKAVEFLNETLKASGECMRGPGNIRATPGYLSFDCCAQFWRRLVAAKPALPASALALIRGTLRVNYPRGALFA
jgi:N-alpha-acetyltransferase 15/16, NatA auxiliary subunit